MSAKSIDIESLRDKPLWLWSERNCVLDALSDLRAQLAARDARIAELEREKQEGRAAGFKRGKLMAAGVVQTETGGEIVDRILVLTDDGK